MAYLLAELHEVCLHKVAVLGTPHHESDQYDRSRTMAHDCMLPFLPTASEN